MPVHLALERGEMRLEVKLEMSLQWLQKRLPRTACEKGMESLVDGDGSWKSRGIAGG